MCWLGSVPIFISEVAKAFPEFHHSMVHIHDRRTHFGITQTLQSRGVEVAHAPFITRQLVDEIDPVAIIFHGTSPSRVESGSWLRRRPTIMFYHGKSGFGRIRSRLLRADLTLFVSRWLFENSFSHRKDEFRPYDFCPPCIDTSLYASIARSPDSERRVVGRLQTDSPRRHPPEVIEIFKEVQRCVPYVSFTIVGGAKYYKNLPLDSVWMPSVGSRLPQSFYKSFDVLLVRNPSDVTDTWSRIVTEGMASGLPVVCENRGGPTEQIDHGENGVLFDSDEECVKWLCQLLENSTLRYTLGMKARKKAVENYGLLRLRKELGGFLTKAALGVI